MGQNIIREEDIELIESKEKDSLADRVHIYVMQNFFLKQIVNHHDRSNKTED